MSVALDVGASTPHYGCCAAAAPAAPRPCPPGAVRRAGALALVAVLGFVGGRLGGWGRSRSQCGSSDSTGLVRAPQLAPRRAIAAISNKILQFRNNPDVVVIAHQKHIQQW